MEEKIKLTKEGLNKLQNELNELIHVIRPEVIEELKAARAQGDLSENADYDAARARQAEVEGQIKKIENMLANAIVIDGKQFTDAIHTGSTVTFIDLSNKKESTYEIVGSVESDPVHGRISEKCDLAKALIGHDVGDQVEVKARKPYYVKITAIK